MIEDRDIPGADPAVVIEQYEPYLQKLANRYLPALSKTGAVGMDDLIQVGRIAAIDAQKKYDPESGSFMNCLFYYVRYAMRRALGFNSQTGEAPAALVYLDAPLSEDKDISLGESITDPDAVPLDEPIMSAEDKHETSEQIRAALDRMKSDKQREVIRRVYLNGQERSSAAAEMGIKTTALYALDASGRSTLRRDHQLRKYAETVPFIHVSISRFNSTWTSATEQAVLWRLGELHKPEVDDPQTGRQ